VITQIDDGNSKFCYHGTHLLTGKSYLLSAESLASIRVGVCDEEFFNSLTRKVPLPPKSEPQQVAQALEFRQGQLRALQEVERLVSYLALVPDDITSRMELLGWQKLTELKRGDRCTIVDRGKPIQAIFHHVLGMGQKYVFLASNPRGTVYRWELRSLYIE
jgi:hypothetical protein